MLALTVALSACGEREAPVPAPPAASPSADVASTGPAVPPGAAWFALEGGGLATLGPPGRWSTIESDASVVTDMQAAPDGTLWLTAPEGVFRVQDGRASPVGEAGRVSVIAAGADAVWAAGLSGLVKLEGQRWRRFEPEVVDATGVPRFVALALGADGTLWVLSSRGLYTFDGAAFAEVDLGPPARWLHSLVLNDEGPRVGHLEGVVEVAEGRPPRHVSHPGLRFMAPVPGGLALATSRAVSAGGREVLALDQGESARALASDATGRIWMSSSRGVIIHGSAGTTRWPLGSVPALGAGVRGIHVVAGGPAIADESR